jgi:hypothetical protein
VGQLGLAFSSLQASANHCFVCWGAWGLSSHKLMNLAHLRVLQHRLPLRTQGLLILILIHLVPFNLGYLLYQLDFSGRFYLLPKQRLLECLWSVWNVNCTLSRILAVGLVANPPIAILWGWILALYLFTVRSVAKDTSASDSNSTRLLILL